MKTAPADLQPNHKGHFERYNRYGYYFLTPFFIVFLIFSLYPIIYTIYLSFTDLAGWNTTSNFVGFKNYLAIIHNDLFIKAIKNTFLLWILNFIPQIGFALLLASWFTNQKLKLKGTTFFQGGILPAERDHGCFCGGAVLSLVQLPNGPNQHAIDQVGAD